MRFLVVDGDSVFRRNWEAPGGNTKSVALNRTVQRIVAEAELFDRVLVAWDSRGPSFRCARGEWYKAERESPGDAYYAERDRASVRLEEEDHVCIVGPMIDVDGYAGYAEADDVIAWAVREWSSRFTVTGHARIVSSDADLETLVCDANNVDILKPGLKRTEAIWTESRIRAARGVEPREMPELKALMGDKDEVRGFPGIGEKCAAMLVRMFGTAIEAATHAPDDMSIEPTFLNARQRASLREFGAERAAEGVWFATLRHDLPLDFGIVLNAQPRRSAPPPEPDDHGPAQPPLPPYARIEAKLDAIMRHLGIG